MSGLSPTISTYMCAVALTFSRETASETTMRSVTARISATSRAITSSSRSPVISEMTKSTWASSSFCAS